VNHAASIFRVLEHIITDAESSSETPVTIYHFTRRHISFRYGGGGVSGGDVDDDGCVGLKYAINIL
jgi:hypothetical protein